METKMNILKSKYQPKNSRDNLWFDGSKLKINTGNFNEVVKTTFDAENSSDLQIKQYVEQYGYISYEFNIENVFAYGFITKSTDENMPYSSGYWYYGGYLPFCNVCSYVCTLPTGYAISNVYLRNQFVLGSKQKLYSAEIDCYDNGGEIFYEYLHEDKGDIPVNPLVVDSDKKYASHIRVEEGSNGEPVLAVYYAKFEDGAEFKKAEISLGGAS